IPMPRGSVAAKGAIAEYLDLAVADSRYIVTEQATAPALVAGVDLSALGVRSIVSGGAPPYGEVPPRVAHSVMFGAGQGNASDLDTDGDGLDVLLYQAFGRKRVCVFPPGAGPLLHPVGGYGTVRLAEMTDAERAAFLSYAGGAEAELGPGDTIFMPA